MRCTPKIQVPRVGEVERVSVDSTGNVSISKRELAYVYLVLNSTCNRFTTIESRCFMIYRITQVFTQNGIRILYK